MRQIALAERHKEADALHLGEAGRKRFDLLVRMMDSSGVGLLLGRYKNVKRLGGVLYVKNVGRAVDRVFEMSGVYQVIGKL